MKRGLTIICIFIIALFLLFPGCSSNESPLLKEKDRDAKWEEDLDFLTQELPKRHKNLFFQMDRADFYSKMNELKSKISQYSDEEMKVEISKVIASVGDAHTMVAVNRSMLYPLKLYWFADGIYVIDASKDYEDALYYKLEKINNRNVDSIIKSLKTVISHENESWYKLLAGYYMVVPEVLKGLRISTSDDIMMGFVNDKGEKFEMAIKPQLVEEINYVNNPRKDDSQPLFLRNSHQYYWYQYLPEKNTMYFQYNVCVDMEEQTFKSFNKEMFKVIDQKKIERLVVDLRNNGGGNSTILHPFLEEIEKRDYLKDRLFIIIGRNTFSSALMNAIELKNQTKAILIGEPTGGKPNGYGEVKILLLKNTGVTVQFSSKYFELTEGETDSLYPDIHIELSFLDYMNKKDPALEWVLENG